MNSPLILSYNDYSRANAEKKEKVKYGGSNLKVYIFLADGFEEIEGLTVVDIMRRNTAGIRQERHGLSKTFGGITSLRRMKHI